MQVEKTVTYSKIEHGELLVKNRCILTKKASATRLVHFKIKKLIGTFQNQKIVKTLSNVTNSSSNT